MPTSVKEGCPAAKQYTVTMILEINIFEDDIVWWIDSSATRYVYKDKNLFGKYESIEDGSILYMGNLSTTIVKKKKGIVELEFTSRKTS